ncbi:MAG TPA: autotransporter-associated beta strand repeat-containing protein, partial [Tepidisphaeraceae bacterium]|nr:autotransporter-associated beta strand repeat-containing protein [Tepidisphaeraceae bacterium]
SINLSGSFTHVINNASLTTYAGVVHTGGFTKAGPGTLVLSGNNIFSGTGTINAGTLRAAHANALGTPQSPTLVADGAALELNGALTAEPVTIRGMGVAAQGALYSIGGANSVATVSVPASALANVTIGSSLKTGPVDVAAGQLLTKTGNGVLSIERVRGGGLAIATGKVAVAGARSNDRTSNVTSLVVPLTGNVQLDLGENDLVYDYTDASPLATVQAAIASGYAGGTWAGPGIISEAVLGTPGTALGYGETAVALGAGSHLFSGQMVDDTSVLIRYTFAGDANLDGSVNLDDFTALAASFGAPATTWTSGDFNYNGATNLDDFTALAANFGFTLPSDVARAAVPEPGMAGVMAMLAAGLVGRVRRRDR